jgi:hypothetical protein
MNKLKRIALNIIAEQLTEQEIGTPHQLRPYLHPLFITCLSRFNPI